MSSIACTVSGRSFMAVTFRRAFLQCLRFLCWTTVERGGLRSIVGSTDVIHFDGSSSDSLNCAVIGQGPPNGVRGSFSTDYSSQVLSVVLRVSPFGCKALVIR